jgi:hypothetical protein
MTKKELKKSIQRILKTEHFEKIEDYEDSNPFEAYYLGSSLSLDPCGKYHHVLSPNGITPKCERFWNNLESVCNELNVWTDSLNEDGLDVFLCRNIKGV